MLFSKMCLQISVCLEDFLWSFSRERLASQKKCVVKVSIHIPLIFACMNITMSWIQTLSIVFSTGSEAVVSVSSGWACHAQVFSRARKWDGMGPGPLRSDTCLWGLPSLSNNDQRKVDIGNRILLFTVRLLRLCEQHGVPYVLENPSSSRAWLMPPLRAFADRYSPFFVELDYCQYNEPWKKPTTLMYNFLDLSSLHRKCNTVKGVCSHTHRQHIVLAGRDSSGQYLTLRAQPYPHALVTAFGHLVAGALGGDKGG